MSEETLFDFQRDILEKEIETIHKQISAYDDISFKIKGWAVTLWSAIIVLGTDKSKLIIVAISLAAVLAFWFLDTYFKVYQRRSMTRMGIIEDFLNSKGQYENNGLTEAFANNTFGDFPIHDPIARLSRKSNEEFARRYAIKTSFWHCFWLKNISLIYIALFIATLIVIIVKIM